MFKDSSSQSKRNGPKEDPDITPAIVSKLSIAAGRRRQQILQGESLAQGTALSDELTVNKYQSSDHSSELSQSTSGMAQLMPTSKSMTRYTITSSASSSSQMLCGNSNLLSVSADSQNGHAFDVVQTNGKQLNDDQTNFLQQPGCETATLDLTKHRGQTANIALPQVQDDLRSRLEVLKQFKLWGERLHKSTTQDADAPDKTHNQDIELMSKVDNAQSAGPIREAIPSTRPAPQHAYRIANELPHCHDVGIVATCIDGPTLFPKPQATQNPAISSKTGLHLSQATHAACTSGSVPQKEPVSEKSSSRPRSRSRTIVITSTATAEPERQPIPQSNSSQATTRDPRPHSRPPKEKRYPPLSFPSTFNERFASPEPRPAQAHQKLTQPARNDTSQTTMPLISPLTNPTVKDDADLVKDTPTLNIPSDKTGRTMFYSTVHYYTECPHASPPATRPLDPDAQPRRDPAFNHTKPAITRSIIPGRCFNCDTLYRRDRENDMVNDCTKAITQRANELAHLVEQLELSSADVSDSDSDEEYDLMNDRHAARLHTPCVFLEDVHDLRHVLSSSSLPPISDDVIIPERSKASKEERTELQSYQAQLAGQIRHLEAQIDELRNSQDSKVEGVWRGYTRRWGPATLGVQRGKWSSSVQQYYTRDDYETLLEHQRKSIDQRLGMPTEIGQEDDDQDVDSDLRAIPSDRSNALSREVSMSRSSSRSVSRGRRTMASRESSLAPSTARTMLSSNSASTDSHRDAAGSKYPGEGKMRVGWIRE